MFDRNTTDRLPPLWIYGMKYLFRNPLLWILPAAALVLELLSFWQPSSLYWSGLLTILAEARKTLLYLGWSVMLLPLCHWIQEQRHVENLDPSVGTGYPVWKILLSQNLCSLTLLGLFGASMIPYFLLEEMPIHFSVVFFLCWLLAMEELMLFLASLRRGNMAGFLWIGGGIAMISWLSIAANGTRIISEQSTILYTISLALLAAACRIAVYQPLTANKARYPRLAVMAVTLLLLCSADTRDAAAFPAVLLLFAALWERYLPGQMQLAQLPESAAERAKQLLLQSGLFPGILAGMLLLILVTALGDGKFLPFGFLLFHFQLAAFLRWKAKMPVVVGLIVVSLLFQVLPAILLSEMDLNTWEPLLWILNPDSEFWNALPTAVQNLSAAGIVLLGALPLYPLYRDYCKKYFSRF